MESRISGKSRKRNKIKKVHHSQSFELIAFALFLLKSILHNFLVLFVYLECPIVVAVAGPWASLPWGHLVSHLGSHSLAWL